MLEEPRPNGPLDSYPIANPIDVVKQRMDNIHKEMNTTRKEIRKRIIQVFYSWMYDVSMSLKAIKYDNFHIVVTFGQFGSEMKPPSYHKVQVP